MDLGVPELLILLAIVILVFGVGRLGALGGELGHAIRQFREGLKDDRAPHEAESAPAARPDPDDVDEGAKTSGVR